MEAFLPLLLIMAIMILPMMWMSSRQRKAQAKQMERVNALGVGDEVRTHAGFIGLIVEDLGETVILEDESGSQSKWLRRAIAGLADEPTAPEAAAGSGASDPATAENLDAHSEPSASAENTENTDTTVRGDGDVPGVTR